MRAGLMPHPEREDFIARWLGPIPLSVLLSALGEAVNLDLVRRADELGYVRAVNADQGSPPEKEASGQNEQKHQPDPQQTLFGVHHYPSPPCVRTELGMDVNSR